MAAPPHITSTNLSGTFALNKSLSDNLDAMLALQGIGWALRKIIGLASIVLTIKEYTIDSTTHIDVITLVAGLDKTQEYRILNWQLDDHTDKIFGKCRHKTRLIKASEYQMENAGSAEDATFLRGEKLKDGKTDSQFLDHELVQNWVEQVGGAGWKVEQVWGFETVDGERRYTRRIVTWNKGKEVRTRLVYDYKGETA